MLTSASLTIAVARAVTYAQERRREAPALRSLIRRGYHAPGGEELRVHHFLPGILISGATGAAGILTRKDGEEFLFSLVLGAGFGLTLDEIGLLLKLDNPYWGSERLVAVQGALAALAAGALGLRFLRSGRTPAQRINPR